MRFRDHRDRRVALAGAALLAVGVQGCTPGQGGWDAEGLGQRYARLAQYSGHRLGDMQPYWAPAADGVVLFLCRWHTDQPIEISLPADASPKEQETMRRALSAWERAGLGIEFREVPRERARLRVDFVDASETAKPLGTANTATDCLVRLPGEGIDRNVTQIDAHVVRASIQFRRDHTDLIGRSVELSADRNLGAAIHELGHALGFPSHTVTGNSVMGRSVDRVRRVGRDVLAGKPFKDPTLAALYAAPSGVVVGHLAWPAERQARLKRLADLARQQGWHGPEVRVGDRASRIVWWDSHQRAVGFLVLGAVGGDTPWIPTTSADERGL